MRNRTFDVRPHFDADYLVRRRYKQSPVSGFKQTIEEWESLNSAGRLMFRLHCSPALGPVTLVPFRMAIFGKSRSPSPEKDSPRHEIRRTYVGPNVRLKGDLTGDEDIFFDGRVEGRVNVARSFRVGPEGQVHADVTAPVVVIGGRVVGNVVASERVELLPTGVLEGNIRAPKIVMAEGAQFRGSVDMESRGGEAAPPDGPQGPGSDAPRKDEA